MTNHSNKILLEGFTFPISGLHINNRIVMAPMTTYSGNEDGSVSEEEIAYYRHRNQSAGLLISACAYVIPQGKAFHGQIGAHSDEMIPSLKRIANSLKENGEKAILQIHHGGRMSSKEELADGQCVSASAIASEREGAQQPRAMSLQEIQDTIDAYGQATRRAQKAGFDGVEIHGANTYLIQQFFSPHSNRRNDKWGGSLLKRMRFPLAVVDSVIQAAEKDLKHPFLIGYRISPEELENPGISINDTLALTEKLSEKKLDYLHISTMNFWDPSLRDSNDKEPRAVLIARKVGKKIPIIAVGGIKTAELAKSVLESGIPLIALGRPLLVDPHWLDKIKNGKEKEIKLEMGLEDQSKLVLPSPMWTILCNRAGWIPFKK